MRKVFLLAFALILCSCSKHNDDIVFKFDSDGAPISLESITKDTFDNEVSGYGWMCVSEQRILEDGVVASKNTWEMYSGAEATILEISDNSLIEYYGFIEAIYGNGKYDVFDIEFNKSKIVILICSDSGNTHWERYNILSVKDDIMTLIHHAAGGVYNYSTYKRLTEEELSLARKSHPKGPGE